MHQFNEILLHPTKIRFGFSEVGVIPDYDKCYYLDPDHVAALKSDAQYLEVPSTGKKSDDGAVLLPAGSSAFAKYANADKHNLIKDVNLKDVPCYPITTNKLSSQTEGVFYGVLPQPVQTANGLVKPGIMMAAAKIIPNDFRLMHNATTQNFNCGGYIIRNNEYVGVHYGFDPDNEDGTGRYGECTNMAFALHADLLN